MMGARTISIACFLALWPAYAAALDASLDVSQYAHTAWRIREGFPKAIVGSVAQTPDGYLWLGTEHDIVRFDGVRAVSRGESLGGRGARALLTTRDGTLWIGLSGGLASLEEGKLVAHPELEGHSVNSILQDRDDTLWVSSRSKTGDPAICALRRGDRECRFDAVDQDRGSILYADRAGRLWAISETDLWQMRPGPPRRFPLPARAIGGLQLMAEDDDGALLVTTAAGVVRVVDGRVEPYVPPGDSAPPRATMLYRDRDGGLWMCEQGRGLLHVHRGRTDRFTRADGLSSEYVNRFFEDREGNLWVATDGGLDRFREFAVTLVSIAQGLPSGIASVAVSRDASLWISSSSGVYRLAGRDTTLVSAAPASMSSLFRDSRGWVWAGGQAGIGYFEGERFVALDGVPGAYVDGFAEDRQRNVWIAHRDLGLLRWSPGGGVARIALKDGRRGFRRIAADPSRDGLWLGSIAGDVAFFDGDRTRETYGPAQGLGAGRVRDLRFDPHGALWIATDGGLGRLKDGRVATLTARDGLPCDPVDWMIEDDAGAHWLYTDCGLVRITRESLAAWIAAVERGDAARPRIAARVLDVSAGFVGSGTIGTMDPHVAKAPDGKLWFIVRGGIAMIDPKSIRSNPLAPPVHVEEVVADRNAYANAGAALKLPPLVRELQIDYTATSFRAPERVRFRYKLEGHDAGWMDAGARRQAFYTDLAPGQYRFRVVAANDSGVWNEEGASLAFSIAPAWWQTNAFRVFLVAAIALLLYGIYRLRLAHVARQFNMKLDARVNERMRIARDLHDTLLQSFHGLLLKFQAVSDLLPSQPEAAKKVLDRAIDQAADAVTEGRDAVQGLRASATETNDLAEAIRTLGEGLAAQYGNGDAPTLRLEVQGVSRVVHPILRDEVFRIAGEAMRNAFRHAHARHVEVELRYDVRELRLRVRDDGGGIDTAVLAQGAREGHFGLPGMRERAQSIGGKLMVWSAPGAGTEVELAVPASHAYAALSAAADERAGERLQGE